MTTAPIRSGAVIAGKERLWFAERFEHRMEQQNRKNKLPRAVMSRSGLARSVATPHQERQIARGSLNQQFLLRVVAASHVQPIHASGVKLMGEVPLYPFPTPGLQSLSPRSLNPPPSGI